MLWFLGAAFTLWLTLTVLWIVGERRSPQSTLAWIMVLGFLPIVGAIIYLTIGPRRYVRQRRKSQLPLNSEGPKQKGGESHSLTAIGQKGCGEAIGTPRNAKVSLYFNGQDVYEAIAEAIDTASHHIHLEYYIWEPDQIGTRLRDRLVLRALDGVKVRIVLDAFGSSQANQKFWRPLTDIGGKVHWFNAPHVRLFRPQLGNFRTHRKIIVVDGKVGFTGGVNVTDVHSAEFSGEAAWRDTHVRLEGAAVHGLQSVFSDGWYDVSGEEFFGHDYFPVADGKGEFLTQIIASGPDEEISPIHKLFVSAISRATERVYLTAPYFIPDEALMAALVTAVLQGADVRVLVPKDNDLRVVGAASRSYYPELLKAGIRIFEYGKSMLHAKTLVVDNVLCLAGTANADPRSFFLNFECVVACYQANACDTFAEVYLGDLEVSDEVSEQTTASYGYVRRFGQNTCRLFSTML